MGGGCGDGGHCAALHDGSHRRPHRRRRRRSADPSSSYRSLSSTLVSPTSHLVHVSLSLSLSLCLHSFSPFSLLLTLLSAMAELLKSAKQALGMQTNDVPTSDPASDRSAVTHPLTPSLSTHLPSHPLPPPPSPLLCSSARAATLPACWPAMRRWRCATSATPSWWTPKAAPALTASSSKSSLPPSAAQVSPRVQSTTPPPAGGPSADLAAPLCCVQICTCTAAARRREMGWSSAMVSRPQPTFFGPCPHCSPPSPDLCPIPRIAEITGLVVERGPNVEIVQLGDVVSVPFNFGCGLCHNCSHGKTNLCLRLNPNPLICGAIPGYADMVSRAVSQYCLRNFSSKMTNPSFLSSVL